MADDKEWKNLKTLDKMVHKSWKSRLEGYDEAIREISICDDKNDRKMAKYTSVISRLLSDSNAVALEKAIDVILLFVQHCNVNESLACEICPKIITNCLGSTRSKTKEKGNSLLKMLIEVERHDIVIKELLNGVGSKQPSVVIGCVSVLMESLREFGPSVLPIKEVLKILPPLFEDRDKNVRVAGKELIVEIYRWVGKQVLTPQINNCKAVILKEIDIEFAKITVEKAIPTRYLRSHKPKPVCSSKLAGGIQNVTKDLAVYVDQYDFIDPVEVISKIPGDFYERIEEKKWTDRKEALDMIDNLTNHKKLSSGDYGDLVKILLRILAKDVNIVLVILASKILIQLAKGLRKKFSPYSSATIQACLDKFKDKKATVIKSLRDCVDAVFETTTLETIIPSIITALSHKNPTIKLETALYLNRILLKSPKESLMKKLLKQLIPSVVKLLSDNAMDVREASFQVLGTAMKVVSESVVVPFLEQIDTVRMARIYYYFEKEEPGNIVPNEDIVPGLLDAMNKEVEIEITENLPFVDTKYSIFLSTEHTQIDACNESPLIDGENVHKEMLNAHELLSDSDHSDRVNINVIQPKKIQSDDKHEQLELGKDNSQLPLQDLEMCKEDDEFEKMMQIMKGKEDKDTDSYNWNIVFNERWEKFNRNRDILSQDPMKKIITSIYNNDIDIASSSIQTMYDHHLLDHPLFLQDYGCLLLIVVSQQLSLIVHKLSNFNKIISDNCPKIMQNLLYIANYILSKDREPLFVNEDIIVATLIVLRNVVQCSQLNTLSNEENVIGWIKLLVSDIYNRSKDLAIADSVSLIAIMIGDQNSVENDPFEDVDINRVLESLYDEHLPTPKHCIIKLESIDRYQIHIDPNNAMAKTMNELRQRFYGSN